MTTTIKAMLRSICVALSAFLVLTIVGAVPATAGETGPATSSPLAPAGSVPGIDVSHWQHTIDWPQVASGGIGFAIAKATQGRTYVDPMYAINKAGATAAGIPFTAYHFAEPDATPGDAVAEADHFVATADLGPGNLPPALDLERTGGLSQRELTTWVLDWLDRVTELLGVRPMVYTSPAGWASRTGDTSAVADAGYDRLWLAHWNVAQPTVPGNGWGGNGWTFWQFSDCVSVPGIDGCVDGDWYGGASVSDHTIRTPDTTSPTATIEPPGGVGRPAVVTFSEAVRDVTAGNIVVTQPDTVRLIDTTITCANGSGRTVDCARGPVRTATVQPQRPLAAAQTYSVTVAPAVVEPTIVDRAGNPLDEVRADFATPTEVEQDSPGVVYGWPEERAGRAFGGSVALERSPGASFSFTFPGRAVSWFTVAGPAQGRAEVFIDGRSRGVFDQYARRTRFGVERRFSGLSRDWHTIVVQALGTRARAANDSEVVVDAFRVGRDVVANPGGTATWRTVDDPRLTAGAAAATDVRGASASFTFRGTGVAWTTVRGPSQGRAAIYVDGDRIGTVDNYAPAPTPGAVRTIDGLIIGEHTLRIVVLGQSRAKARDSLVTIDRLAVIP